MNNVHETAAGGGGGPPAATTRAAVAAWWHLLVRVTLAVLAVYLTWRVRGILTMVLVALVVSCAATAVVDPLCRLRLPFVKRRAQRVVATTVVFVFFAVAIAGAVELLLHPFAVEYDHLHDNWPEYRATFLSQIGRARDLYAGLPPEMQTFLQKQLSGSSLPSPGGWAVGAVGGALGGTVTLASAVVDLLLVPILAFYFTLDARQLRKEALALVPRGQLRATMAILDESAAILRDYVVAQFWLAVIAGTATAIGLRIFGMDYVLVLAIFAGVSRAIPVVGPVIGGIPIVALAFVYGAQHGNPMLWIEVLGFFTALHLIESKFVMPKFLGHRLHLHAAVILIVLLLGGEFFGLIGMFLAAPVAALGRVLLTHYVVLPRRRAELSARAARRGVAAARGDIFTAAEAPSGRTLRLDRAIRTMTTSGAGSSGGRTIGASTVTTAKARSSPPTPAEGSPLPPRNQPQKENDLP